MYMPYVNIYMCFIYIYGSVRLIVIELRITTKAAHGGKIFKFRCVPKAVWSQFEEFGFILGLSGLELLVFRPPRVFKYRYETSSDPQMGPRTTHVLWDHMVHNMTKSPAEGPVVGAAREPIFLRSVQRILTRVIHAYLQHYLCLAAAYGVIL